ncbi:MAG: hypothetical protein LBQ79_00560 [Deltaproteobacteria bacterium]|jgi:hypothetical protein|nr:hypothetical protein [Deltaproteobacteria bacterium]
MDAVIIGADSFSTEVSDDDIEYAIEVGLLGYSPDSSDALVPSNPIYGELNVMAFTRKFQRNIPSNFCQQQVDG